MHSPADMRDLQDSDCLVAVFLLIFKCWWDPQTTSKPSTPLKVHTLVVFQSPVLSSKGVAGCICDQTHILLDPLSLYCRPFLSWRSCKVQFPMLHALPMLVKIPLRAPKREAREQHVNGCTRKHVTMFPLIYALCKSLRQLHQCSCAQPAAELNLTNTLPRDTYC